MKKLIVICMFLFAFQITAFCQCGINQKEVREKYCTGTYLVHSELDNSSPDVEIALKKGNNYSIYLLNADHTIKNFSMTDSRNQVVSLEEGIFAEYSVYRFVPQISDTYKFKVDFGTEEKACVLWTVYQQNENHLVQGFYRNFEELKYNNPSVKFNYTINEKTRKYDGYSIAAYRVNIDRRDAKQAGKVIGFSDGKNLYLNESNSSLSSSTDFFKAEFIGKYYFFENVRLISVSTGTTVVTVPKIEQKIMDMNTGEVTILNMKTLQAMIADDEQLLSEFQSSSNKRQSLKEFLVRYMKEKYKE